MANPCGIWRTVSVFGDIDNDNDGVPTWDNFDDTDPSVQNAPSGGSGGGGGGGDDDFPDPNDTPLNPDPTIDTGEGGPNGAGPGDHTIG